MTYPVQKPLYMNASLLYTMGRAELAGYANQAMSTAQYEEARKKLADMPMRQMVSPDAALALVLGGTPFAGWFDADDRDDAVVMRRRDLYRSIILHESMCMRKGKGREYLETFEDVLNGYIQGYMPWLHPVEAAEYINSITRELLSIR